MENILFIGGVGFQEILLIALVVLLFFGGKKIPELMKGLGKGVRSFKDGMNGKDDDDDTPSKTDKDKNDAKGE
ncbi:MAG: twin-arginine translocase TatA/TatE family subunit [Prevotella sp.]